LLSDSIRSSDTDDIAAAAAADNDDDGGCGGGAGCGMSVVCGSSVASVLAGFCVCAVTRRAMGTLPCTPVISGDAAVMVLLLTSTDDDDDDDGDGTVTTLVCDSSYHTHTQHSIYRTHEVHIIFIKLLTAARASPSGEKASRYVQMLGHFRQ